ncbi:hypothetical protein ACET3Z_005268 [Daucus carota]
MLRKQKGVETLPPKPKPKLLSNPEFESRFIIGRTGDKAKVSELVKEVEKFDDFMLLVIKEEYSKLPYKLVLILVSSRIKTQSRRNPAAEELV